VIVFADAAGGSFEVRVDGRPCDGIVSGDFGYGRAGSGLLAALDAALA